MRAIKLIVLSWLAVAGLMSPCRAQAGADKIRYHWVTQDQVILWQSADDAEPVTASLAGGRWVTPAANTERSWRLILEGVVRFYYPQAVTKDLQYSQLWEFVLTKLRNEYAAVSWAQPREPSAELYLLRRDAQTVEVVINSKVDDQRRRTSATFRQPQPGGPWVATPATPQPEALLGLAQGSEELRKIFGAAVAAERTPNGAVMWAAWWDKWIANALNATSPLNTMYKDARGRPQWLWVERLAAGTSPPPDARQMPQAPPQIAEPALPGIGGGGGGGGGKTGGRGGGAGETPVDWVKWAVLAAAVLLGVSLLAYGLGYGRMLSLMLALPRGVAARFRRAAPKGPAGRERTTGHTAPAVPAETLEKLHTTVRERWEHQFPRGTPFGELLHMLLEWVRGEYGKAAADGKLVAAVGADRQVYIGAFLKEEVGVESADAAQLKRWVELGRSVESAFARPKTNGLKNLDEVLEGVDGAAAQRLPHEELFARFGSKILAVYDQRVTTLTTEYQALERSRNDEKLEHARAAEARRKEADKKLQESTARLESEKAELVRERDAAQRELESSRRKVAELQGTVSGLEEDLRAAAEATRVAKEDLVGFEAKARRMLEIQRLSRHLRQWLQGYCNAHGQDENGLRPVALLATLINFSLSQMSFSVSQGQEELLRVTANNVFRLTKMFEQRAGGESNLAAAQKSLAAIAPGVETALEELGEAALKSTGLDASLYRSFLSRLNTDTGKNLSPFYIDMDESGKLVRVSVS